MKKYHHKIIEKKWQKQWLREKTYEPDLRTSKNPFYNLMMFPYPSAEGLHVGNMYAFVGSDIYGRFERMRGKDVFEPIGLDGFGIHAESYALKIGAHPARQAQISEKRFYKQLAAIGNGFAWDERLETYDPEYYRSTQRLFIQMWKRGLAYRKKAAVNWCTGCLTVLADEQVIGRGDRVGGSTGVCERCGNKVIQKELEQWFFKITDYADRLLKNLDTLDWSEKVKVAQRNWIGKSEGVVIGFRVQGLEESIEVFTTRPDTIMGVTFLAVATGSRYAGMTAAHPITGVLMPICEAEYVVGDYGTGAVMGVPAHDERDRAFAEARQLSVSGAPLMDAHEAIKKSGGKKETRYRLRDWLISRQRYWGPPIPMILCASCGWQAVPEKDLPVVLPRIKNFRPTGTGESPLASVASFYKTTCPQCNGSARRETDVSDTFLDSSWYYLGYLSSSLAPTPHIKRWLPVHMYIGGAEHSVLHLLYARFVAMALHDGGLVDFDEPFTKFRAHGLLIKEGAKMSKSKGNVVNPDEYIARFGADTLRMYLMFLAPFSEGGDFRDEAVLGVHRFLNRVWILAHTLNTKNYALKTKISVEKELHYAIKKITYDIENLHYNTAISALMILLRAFEEKGATEKHYKIFIQLLAPFAPHMAEELWALWGEKKSIHHSSWPQYDEALITEEIFNLVVQINGKTRAVIAARTGISQGGAEKLAASDATVAERLKNMTISRIIFVKDHLINLIAS